MYKTFYNSSIDNPNKLDAFLNKLLLEDGLTLLAVNGNYYIFMEAVQNNGTQEAQTNDIQMAAIDQIAAQMEEAVQRVHASSQRVDMDKVTEWARQLRHIRCDGTDNKYKECQHHIGGKRCAFFSQFTCVRTPCEDERNR